MDLHQLEYLIAIAETQSISRAAENLLITQSTLSQYLTRLEAELGIPLFERGKKMKLTPGGKMYVQSCERILREKKDLYRRLADLAHSRTGSFTIGVTPQWGSVAWAHVLVPFTAAYPNVRVSVREEIAAPLIRDLKDGKVDMAVIPFAENSTLPAGSILLQTEELLLAMPKACAEIFKAAPRRGDGLPMADVGLLADTPMIFSTVQTTVRKLEDACFADKGVEPRIVCEINSHPASLDLVEQGFGATFVPLSCARPSADIVYAHADPPVQWFVTFCFRKELKIQQCEKYLIGLFKDYFKAEASAPKLKKRTE